MGKESLLKHIDSLPDGDYFIEIYVEKDLRKVYFKKLETLSKDVGYSKNELHEMCRDLLKLVFQDPDNLNVIDFNDIKSYSTKYLSPQGWKCYIDSVTLWCLDHFDYVI